MPGYLTNNSAEIGPNGQLTGPYTLCMTTRKVRGFSSFGLLNDNHARPRNKQKKGGAAEAAPSQIRLENLLAGSKQLEPDMPGDRLSWLERDHPRIHPVPLLAPGIAEVELLFDCGELLGWRSIDLHGLDLRRQSQN